MSAPGSESWPFSAPECQAISNSITLVTLFLQILLTHLHLWSLPIPEFHASPKPNINQLSAVLSKIVSDFLRSPLLLLTINAHGLFFFHTLSSVKSFDSYQSIFSCGTFGLGQLFLLLFSNAQNKPDIKDIYSCLKWNSASAEVVDMLSELIKSTFSIIRKWISLQIIPARIVMFIALYIIEVTDSKISYFKAVVDYI